jgi:hypothetical protein
LQQIRFFIVLVTNTFLKHIGKMTKFSTFPALLAVSLLFGITACKKTDKPSYPDPAQYYPLTVGKYITYKMDSTNYIGYTVTPTVTSYFVRDVVDAQVTDNLNRKSYRIVRFIKDSLSQPTWRNNNSFMVTPLEKSYEYVENNLRFIRLQTPIADGFGWPGTTYIGANGGNPSVQFFSDPDWSYHFENIGKPYPVFTTTVTNTITVNQADGIGGFPADPSAYSDRNFGKEVFGKDIGLIYKEFLHWSYQPPSGGAPGYRAGYGVKLTMIDHN